jgi:hypothetical protein
LHPLLRVDLEEQVSEAVVTSLREGRADLGVFVEGPDIAGLSARVFRHDQLVLVLPRGHRLAGARTPLPFSEALDEDWIGLNPGAAMLQKQQQAALAAGKPLRLRMQVRSFDAVCHLVASGLGIAMLPAAAALPIPCAPSNSPRDRWPMSGRGAGCWSPRWRGETTPAWQSLVNFMVEPSQTAKRAGTGPADRRPVCGKTLADFGADVVKIEPPGAATRCATGACSRTAPRCGGRCSRATSARWRWTCARPEGQDIVRQLAPRPMC